MPFRVSLVSVIILDLSSQYLVFKNNILNLFNNYQETLWEFTITSEVKSAH